MSWNGLNIFYVNLLDMLVNLFEIRSEFSYFLRSQCDAVASAYFPHSRFDWEIFRLFALSECLLWLLTDIYWSTNLSPDFPLNAFAHARGVGHFITLYSPTMRHVKAHLMLYYDITQFNSKIWLTAWCRTCLDCIMNDKRLYASICDIIIMLHLSTCLPNGLPTSLNTSAEHADRHTHKTQCYMNWIQLTFRRKRRESFSYSFQFSTSFSIRLWGKINFHQNIKIFIRMRAVLRRKRKHLIKIYFNSFDDSAQKRDEKHSFQWK